VSGLTALAAAVGPPGAPLLVAAGWASVIRLLTYTVAGVMAQPHPMRSALAFALLPFYLVWRIGAAIASLKMLGDKPWVRTARE
jgi:hypothetical protein